MPCPSIKRDYYPIKPQNSSAPYFLNITEVEAQSLVVCVGCIMDVVRQTYTSKGLPLLDDLKFVHFSRNLRIAQL
mgnify:CR=1 FL=1